MVYNITDPVQQDTAHPDIQSWFGLYLQRQIVVGFFKKKKHISAIYSSQRPVIVHACGLG